VRDLSNAEDRGMVLGGADLSDVEDKGMSDMILVLHQSVAINDKGGDC